MSDGGYGDGFDAGNRHGYEVGFRIGSARVAELEAQLARVQTALTDTQASLITAEVQLASKDQLIAEQNNLAKERQEWALHTNEVIRELKAQLADTEALEISHGERIEKLTKLLLLAKEALENCEGMLDELRGFPVTHDLLIEALAAINDSKLVKGLILCDAEPVGEVEAIDVDDDAQPSAWVCINTDIELGTPLYAPRRPN